ncbi:hypothetical protein TNCV_377011 [Trichonephila clavipes]|nr:hypothetical protein TNCV_377011 [Trichonephila clavipes]
MPIEAFTEFKEIVYSSTNSKKIEDCCLLVEDDLIKRFAVDNDNEVDMWSLNGTDSRRPGSGRPRGTAEREDHCIRRTVVTHRAAPEGEILPTIIRINKNPSEDKEDDHIIQAVPVGAADSPVTGLYLSYKMVVLTETLSAIEVRLIRLSS